MSQSRLKQLREQRAVAHAKAVEFLKAETQTAETRSGFDAAQADVDTIGADIARIERSEKMEAELRATVTEPVAPAPAGAEPTFEQRNAEYNGAFLRALRTSKSMTENGQWDGLTTPVREALERGVAYERSLAENRDIAEGNQLLHIGTYSGLGFFIPTGFINKIDQATKWYAPLLDGSILNVFTTSTGNALPFPVSNDTNNGAVPVTEATAVTTSSVIEPTASQIVFGAHKFTSGLVKMSIELLQDSAFDLETWLAQRFGERWGRGMENYLTNGSGNGQPTGILTAIAASGATPVTAVGSSESTGGSQTGANSIGNSDLVDLEHSVDPSYRRNGRYMFHDTTLASFKKILDKYGRPLWQPGLAADAPDTLNGYKYVINQSMPQIGASNVTVAFGDFSKFMVRKVKELSVMKLVELYAANGQVGFISFARVDANLIDAGTHPLNVIQQGS